MPRRCMIAVAACAACCLLAVPDAALAASFTDAVTDVTGKVNDVALAVGYGLLTLVAGIALIALAKEILPAMLAGRQTAELTMHMKAAIVVLVLCLLAAFAPAIISAIAATAGTGVDLGSLRG